MILSFLNRVRKCLRITTTLNNGAHTNVTNMLNNNTTKEEKVTKDLCKGISRCLESQIDTIFKISNIRLTFFNDVLQYTLYGWDSILIMALLSIS